MDIDVFQIPGILKRRKLYILGSILVCVLAAAAYVAVMKPVYASSVELLLDPAALLADNPDRSSTSPAPGQDQSSLDSQIYVVTGQDTLYGAIRKLDLTKDMFLAGKTPFASEAEAEAVVAAVLRKRLKVARVGASLVMTITAEHINPRRAADIANAVAESYLQQVDSARSDAARRAGQAFQVQASELRDRVLKAELAVERFRAEKGLVRTGERGLVVDQQLAAINDQLTAARVAEEQQRIIYDQAQKLDIAAIQAGAIPEVLQSLTMNQLRDRYVQLLDRQTQLSTTLGAGHPQLQAIRSQVANMQQAVSQELNRIRQSVKANYDRAAANTRSLADRLGQLTRSSFDSDEAQIKLRQLENEADAVRAVYKNFLGRAEELGQQQTVNTNNSRIITAAAPSGTVSTTLKAMIVVAAALFGTALGCALAVGREVAGHLLGGRAPVPQTAEAADLPVLAIVPPAVAEPAGARGAALFRLSPAERKAREVDSRRKLAVLRATEAVLENLDEGLPASIAFVGAAHDPAAIAVIDEIVEALVECGQEVFYARALKPRRRQPTLRPGAPRIAAPSRRRRAADDFPLAETLEYERLTARSRERYAVRPTFSRFLEQEGGGHFAVIVNGCTAGTAPHRQAILRACDHWVLIGERPPLKTELAEIERQAGGKDALGLILMEA